MAAPDAAVSDAVRPASSGLPAAVRRLVGSWASRSLAVGAVATVLDLGLGTLLLSLGAGTRWAAMAGIGLGGLFSYFANRAFAFKDAGAPGPGSALRFALVTAGASLLHGQLVVWLRDAFGVPFVLSKMASDLVVFNLGQLLLLRYLVFPRREVEAGAVAAPPPEAPAGEALEAA